MFICISNLPGLVLGTFYYISSVSLLANGRNDADANSLRTIEIMLVFGVAYYGAAGMYVGLFLSESDKSFGESVFALSGNVLSMVYYAAPLSTIQEVISNEDSSSLYAPMLVANLANSLMWTIYGFYGIDDVFVYIPNAIGAALASLQLSLTLVYPNKANILRQQVKF
jgi:hypothetical protein